MPLLIGPGLVATMGPRGVIADGGVLVEGDHIANADDFAALRDRHPHADVLDAGGGLMIPGLTCAHTHLYGLFARGFTFPGPPPRSFRQLLEQVWWRLDRALAREAVYLSGMYSLTEHLRAGVTAVVDHHASPNDIPGSLSMLAAAACQLGIRACLCYEVTDRNGPDGAAAGIAENLRFIRESGGPLLAAKFGLHAAFTLSDETLDACARAAQGLGDAFPGFHIHLAEGPEDPVDSLRRSGMRTVQRLGAHGILGPKTLAGHGIHLDDDEVAILAATGTVVTHQPQSNMGNAVGWPRILAMRERGVRVALGTDGYTPDMLATLRAAFTLHSHASSAPGAGVGEFTRILQEENPALLSEIFGVRLGQLVPGAAADLVITSYRPPTPLTAANLAGHVAFGLSAAHVETVLVGGRIVLRDRRVVGVDEVALAAESQRVAAAVWKELA